MHFVYVIKSEVRNYIYVGLSNDLDRRFAEHDSGNNKTTKPYAPFKLIYTERCESRQIARDREKYLKSGIGREFLRGLV